MAHHPRHGLTGASIVFGTMIGAAAIGLWAVVQQTILRVESSGLLPRWDLATHLAHGWIDFYLLTTGQIHRFLWDLWEQGYWPPGLSLFQLPFFVLLGGDIFDGLWSSVAAFMLLVVVGGLTLRRVSGTACAPAAAIFAALLLSSPYLLAYASLSMTEMLGALVQVVVVWRYGIFLDSPTPRAARGLALSLTLLFFVKYNYFLLLAVPLVAYEMLRRTDGWSIARRVGALGHVVRAWLWTPTGILLAAYAAFLAAISISGGFEARLMGQRISVRSIGSSGQIVLYALLARILYLHAFGRIDWNRLFASDPLIRPLLTWFVLPVTVWLASPYPNHIRDVANLVVNRPMGEADVERGLVAYFAALRDSYAFNNWSLGLVLLAFATAAVRYPRRPHVVRLLAVAIPLQLAAVLVHQTRFTRFLLLTVVLLYLAAASELARWLQRVLKRPLLIHLAALGVVLLAACAPFTIVQQERFRVLAFEHYTESPALSRALAAIRESLTAGDRLIVLGQSNQLSPALFRILLGPPSGAPGFPFEIAGEDRLDLDAATKVVLVRSQGDEPSPDPVVHQPNRLKEFENAVQQRQFARRFEYAVPDLRVSLHVFERSSPPLVTERCR